MKNIEKNLWDGVIFILFHFPPFMNVRSSDTSNPITFEWIILELSRNEKRYLMAGKVKLQTSKKVVCQVRKSLKFPISIFFYKKTSTIYRTFHYRIDKSMLVVSVNNLSPLHFRRKKAWNNILDQWAITHSLNDGWFQAHILVVLTFSHPWTT